MLEFRATRRQGGRSNSNFYAARLLSIRRILPLLLTYWTLKRTEKLALFAFSFQVFISIGGRESRIFMYREEIEELCLRKNVLLKIKNGEQIRKIILSPCLASSAIAFSLPKRTFWIIRLVLGMHSAGFMWGINSPINILGSFPAPQVNFRFPSFLGPLAQNKKIEHSQCIFRIEEKAKFWII